MVGICENILNKQKDRTDKYIIRPWLVHSRSLRENREQAERQNIHPCVTYGRCSKKHKEQTDL